MQLSVRLSRTARRCRRRGVSTIWILAALPALIAAFLVIAELGHLWQARVELENGLESAALAAAKEWGQGGLLPLPNWTVSARTRGQTLAAANSIDGQPIVLGTNLGAYNLLTNPNENGTYLPGEGPPPTGNLVFGRVIEVGPLVRFNANQVPIPLVTLYGVRAQATVRVPSLFGSYFGLTYASHTVTADATAAYDTVAGRTRLVRVDNYIHP